MWKNYLNIAIRNIWRQKGYSAISIAGLAVGLACCLLILLFVHDELSYDRYHENADRIYRLTKGTSANTPELWAPAITDEFPDIQHAVRVMGGFSRALVWHGDETRSEPAGLYADAEIFSVFSWPLTQGNPAEALVAPYSIVLTEPMAEEYFGGGEAIGQTLSVGGISNDGERRDYTVTGIMAPVPRNSHFRFDYLISFKTVEVLDAAGAWGTPLGWTNRMAKTYLQFEENARPENFMRQLPDFLGRHIPADEQYTKTDAGLQPLTTIHLRSNLRSEFEPGATAKYVYLFSALALFILVIACINFMNLATARSRERAREVGMRKVLGARRQQIIGQFLGEAVILSLVALAFAVGLLFSFRPVFSALTGRALESGILTSGPMILAFLALAIVVGVLAGSYPAFVLSSYRPAHVLKGELPGSAGGLLIRRGLVVFQFVVSIALIASTFVVYGQLDYLRNKDLGFDQEQVVVMRIGHAPGLRGRAELIKQKLVEYPAITAATASHSIPSQFLNGFPYRRAGDSTPERTNLGDVSVGHDFVETFGLELLAGRDFRRDLASDSSAFVLNESAVREMGWTRPEEAIGQQLEWGYPVTFEGPVVGVVRDFHFGSLRSAIPPIGFHISRFGSNFVAARLQPDDVAGTIAFLEATWKSFEPDYPFEYFFVDDQFASAYTAEARLARTFSYGAIIAVFIACLGLFGVAAFSVERRRKEIGVRKVLGATTGSVVVLFSRDFVVLVLLAFFVAVPLAYVAMNRWLAGFAYHVNLGPGVFIAAGTVALVVAIVTVSYHAMRAALADPVRSLRYE